MPTRESACRSQSAIDGEAGAWPPGGPSVAILGRVTDCAPDDRWYIKRFNRFLQPNINLDARLPDIIRSKIHQIAAEFRGHDEAEELRIVE